VDAAAKPTVEEMVARARARVNATGVRLDAKAILQARDAEHR